MLKYRPPKKLRALFIIHYAPLLLIIMIGPLTGIFEVWKLPLNMLASIVLGIILFLIGTYIYFKWEIFWRKAYHGQLVKNGIFQKIRHPHYTSLLVIGFGLAFFFYSVAALLLAVISIPIMIWSILDEEKHLIMQYGEEYEKYRQEVPWRIVPKIF